MLYHQYFVHHCLSCCSPLYFLSFVYTIVCPVVLLTIILPVLLIFWPLYCLSCCSPLYCLSCCSPLYYLSFELKILIICLVSSFSYIYSNIMIHKYFFFFFIYRCEKKCPFPFIMERPGTECICDCKDDTLSCLKIKYGIEPLSEQSFRQVLCKHIQNINVRDTRRGKQEWTIQN